jgi:cobalt-zinc-cadmium efflux system membrane fusion protein
MTALNENDRSVPAVGQAMAEPDYRRQLPETAPGPRHHRRLIPVRALIIGIGLGIAAVWGYGKLTDTHEKSGSAVADKGPKMVRQGYRVMIPEGSPLRNYITVDEVREEAVERRLQSPAVVEPDPARLVRVLPPVGGRVTQVHVQLGDQVTAGQPLLTLDSSDLSTAFADDHKARMALELAQKGLRRLTELRTVGAIALRDLEQAQTDFGLAQTEYQRTQSRLKQLGGGTNDRMGARELLVRAPMNGSVIELSAARGAVWNDSTTALMTIADLSAIWVTANLPEKDAYLINRGEKVEAEFNAYPSVTYYGKVLFVSDVLDPDTRRIKARIAFDNPGTRLKPGMFANVTFISVAEKVPVAPTGALLLLRDRTQVYVEVEPWVFVPREVEPSYQQGDLTAIRRGLDPGTRVISRGGVLLND